MMLFLTLHNDSDREKFFKRIKSLRENVSIIDQKVKNPEARRIIEDIKSKTDELQSIGYSLIYAHDNEIETTGNFSLQKNEEAIRKLDDVASKIREDGVNLAKLEVSLQNEQDHSANENAAYLFNVILFISLFGIIGAMVLGYIIAGNIEGPVIKLKEAADEIGKGNFDTRIDVKQIDDIGELAAAFNKMAKDLRKSVNELKEAEKELRESETKYRIVADNTYDWEFWLSPEGKFIYTSPSCKRITGHDAEEFMADPDLLYRIISPDDRQHFANHFNDAVQKMQPSDTEFRIVRPDGTHRWIGHICQSVFDNDGHYLGVRGNNRDITENKKAVEMRIENERLAYATKAKSEFLANMSHELRTPLNSIIGFSELMKQKTVGIMNTKQEHYIDNILISGKFLLSLISDILDLSKVEAGKLELTIEKISVPEIINESIVFIKEKAAKHNVLLKTDLDTQLDFIEADRLRFKQILFNLLSNAVKFSKKEGGTVTITAKKDGDMAKFSVSDRGIGIKEENISKLFEKFEQLDSGTARNYGGTGLGLAISKKLVEMHGGKIRAESKYGEGSTFTFSIPIKTKRMGIK